MTQKWMTSGASRLRARQGRTFGARAQRRSEACAASASASNPLDLGGGGGGADYAAGAPGGRAGRKRRRRTAVATVGAVDPAPSAEDGSNEPEGGAGRGGGGVLGRLDERISASAGSDPKRNRRIRRGAAREPNGGMSDASGRSAGPRRLPSVAAAAAGQFGAAGGAAADYRVHDHAAAASAAAVAPGLHKKAPKRRSNEDPPYVPPAAAVMMAADAAAVASPEAMELDPAAEPGGAGGGIGPLGGGGAGGGGLRLPKRSRTDVASFPADATAAAGAAIVGGARPNDLRLLEEQQRSALLRQRLRRQRHWLLMSGGGGGGAAELDPAIQLQMERMRREQEEQQLMWQRRGQEGADLAATGANAAEGHERRYHRSNSMPMNQSFHGAGTVGVDGTGMGLEAAEDGRPVSARKRTPVHRSSSMPFASPSAIQRVDQETLAQLLAERANAVAGAYARLSGGDIGAAGTLRNTAAAVGAAGGIGRFQNRAAARTVEGVAAAAAPVAYSGEAQRASEDTEPGRGLGTSAAMERLHQKIHLEAASKRNVTPPDAATATATSMLGSHSPSPSDSAPPKLRYFNNGVEVDVEGVPIVTPATGKTDLAGKSVKDRSEARAGRRAQAQDSAVLSSSEENPRNISVVSAPTPASARAIPARPSGSDKAHADRSPALGCAAASSVASHISPPANTEVSSAASSDLSPPLPRSCSFADVLSYVRDRVPELSEALELVGRKRHGDLDAILRELYFFTEAATMESDGGASHLRGRVTGCIRAVEGYKRGLVASDAGGPSDPTVADEAQVSSSKPAQDATPKPAAIAPASTMPAATATQASPSAKMNADPSRVTSPIGAVTSQPSSREDVHVSVKATETPAGSRSGEKASSVKQQSTTPKNEEQASRGQNGQHNDVQRLQAQQAEIWASMFTDGGSDRKAGKAGSRGKGSAGVAASSAAPRDGKKSGKKNGSGGRASGGPHSDLINDIFGAGSSGGTAAEAPGADEQCSVDAPGEVDPTPSKLGNDPDKIARASVEDLVQDSLKEREKTLSAANVLMGFISAGR